MKNTIIGICVAVIMVLLGYIFYTNFSASKSNISTLETENAFTSLPLEQQTIENKLSETKYQPEFITKEPPKEKEYSPEELAKLTAEYEAKEKAKTYTYIRNSDFMGRFYNETTYEKLLALYKPKTITIQKFTQAHDENSVFWTFETGTNDTIVFYNRPDLETPWLNDFNILSDKFFIDEIKIGASKSILEKKFGKKISGNTLSISHEDPDSFTSVEFSFEKDILKSIVYNSYLD